MKISKYLLICLIATSTVYSQIPEWIVFKSPKPFTKNSLIEQNWLSINIFRNETNKSVSPLNYNTKIENPFILTSPTSSTISGNFIICTLNDKEGNIWIGTEKDGLVKFDGTNWFAYNSTNSGLPNNTIYSLAIDINNILWIGTRDGLAKFDGAEWTIFTTSNSSLPGNVIYSMSIESNGVKWIGTSRGLARFDDYSWKIFNTKNSKLQNNSIAALNIDTFGNKWIGTFEGLIKYDDKAWQIINRSNSKKPFYDIYSINFDDYGNPFIATWGNGLASFNGLNWTFLDKRNSALPDDFVSSMLIDKNGNKWIGTLNGLVKYSRNKWVIYNSSNSPLPNDSVYSLMSDQNGNLWIGTQSGLAVYHEGGFNYLLAELSEFEVKVEDYKALLSWKSELAKNTEKYEIEKKIEGKDWDQIGSVDGCNKNNPHSRLSFLDKYNSTGQVQYRLKEISKSGGVKYSSEVEALINKPYRISLDVDYLNKLREPLIIGFSLHKKGAVNILIKNIYGQKIYSWRSQILNSGFYQITIPSKKISTGIYNCIMNARDNIIVKNISVIQ
jgi:ligand-binding sensor domain-containing protein